ncbi:hypothetical protein Droror1_Dr00009788 [Drosera rotundifolia]
MDPRLIELSTTFELFKEAQINNDPLTSDRILSQLELLLARFRSLPSSSEQGPDAARGQSDARCCHCASPIGARDNQDFSSSSIGMYDSEIACDEHDIDEELIYTTGSSTKLQRRKVKCRARWNDAIGMAEVIEQKGQVHVTMGITRGGKIYCSIEETLFLAELGALILLDGNGASLSLRYMYKKVANGKVGCNWEMFEVYRHLKSLGFIVGRHGVPWSPKATKDRSASLDYTEQNGEKGGATCEEEKLIIEQIQVLQIENLRPVFDVYLPNSKFRKSSPGDLDSHIYLTGADPPSIATIPDIERRSNGIPLRFGHVDHGRNFSSIPFSRAFHTL